MLKMYHFFLLLLFLLPSCKACKEDDPDKAICNGDCQKRVETGEVINYRVGTIYTSLQNSSFVLDSIEANTRLSYTLCGLPDSLKINGLKVVLKANVTQACPQEGASYPYAKVVFIQRF